MIDAPRIPLPCSFYWEICPKLDENGKLKQEMILVWSVSSCESAVG